MASGGALVIKSPKSEGNKKEGKKEGGTKPSASPKGGGGQCLCSPTTHQGSFRCRFHRSVSSAFWRSKSMPSKSTAPVVAKPLETA